MASLQPEPGVTRIDVADPGDVRQTAINACQEVRPDPDSAAGVLVSRDDEFADALARSSLLNVDSCIRFTEGGPNGTLDPRVRPRPTRWTSKGAAPVW